MHKKLESELVSIAHNILQMKNKNDVVALKNKAQELYERLSVLAFVDEYLATTPNATETKEELIEKIEEKMEFELEETQVEELSEAIEEETVSTTEEVIEEAKEEPVKVELQEEPVEEVEDVQDKTEAKEEIVDENSIEEPAEEETPKKQLSLEEEFKDAVSVDVTADLFQKASESTQTKPTLNDTLLKKNIQVGLNDRIAFVKHLFNHSQADFNRVLSQLNSIDNEKEAKSFISKMVKPDYDWDGKEEYEARLIELIERRY